MADSSPASDSQDERIEIHLKNPVAAFLLAWLIPGAGHFYQGRVFKGAIFSLCILGTFLTGVLLGGDSEIGRGRVVYVNWPEERSLPNFAERPFYACQLCAGAVATPAMIQAKNPADPPLGKFMAPPNELNGESLNDLNRKLGRRWELGTVFTVIAGLMNILAIYDACCGPVTAVEESKPEEPDPADGEEQPDGDAG
ncbi:MAG: hypothetical protein N2C14_07900 [Planctomycetales bacterium]